MLGLLLSCLVGCSDSREEPPQQAPQTTAAKKAETAPVEKTEAADPRVAIVGPMNIYLSDILKLTREAEAAPVIGMASGTETESIRQMRRETLRRLIDRRLLVLESAQHPEWVSDASWEEEVQRLYVRMGAEEIEQRRLASGATQDEFDDQFRRFVREEMMIRELAAREIENATPPLESEVRERYEQDRESVFTRPDSWAVYRIERYVDRDAAVRLPELLQDLDRIRSEVAEAVESATSIPAKAERMAPFVRQYSEAEDAQIGYAYIYDSPKVRFDPEFMNRVKGAELGVLSPVFELAGDEKKVGGCFFLAFEHRPGQTVSFETARPVLEKQMMEERTAERRKALFERLEQKFPSEIDEEALNTGLSAPVDAAAP